MMKYWTGGSLPVGDLYDIVDPCFFDRNILDDCDVEGDVEWFWGKETISFKDVQVYECLFHGGLIE